MMRDPRGFYGPTRSALNDTATTESHPKTSINGSWSGRGRKIRPTSTSTDMTTWLTTVREAADYIRASESTIREAVEMGYLQAYPIGAGTQYRLTAEDIGEWMKSPSWEPAPHRRFELRDLQNQPPCGWDPEGLWAFGETCTESSADRALT